MNSNLKFYELTKGQVVNQVEKFSIKDIDSFINFSGDNSSIHASKNEAESKGFRDRVIHGAMIISKVSKLIGTILPGDSALLLNINFDFKQPLYAEDLFQISAKIAEKHASVECITIKFDIFLKDNNIKIAKGSALVKINNV
jgi:3-hydroxybutyryl-CoA dehydratase